MDEERASSSLLAPDERPLICIVIVNYNGYADTASCLKTLREISYSPVIIVVVHNGCHDGSDAKLQTEFPNIHHIVSDKNLGFSGGNNLGIHWAFEQNAKHVLLLNNDTFVTPGFLEPLVARLESDSKIGAVSGKIYYAPQAMNGKSNILWYAGAFQKWHTGFHHYGVFEQDRGSYDTPHETLYASGCLMLLRGSVVNEIGMLSEEYFLYWEEADWCFRAREHGYASFYEPKSVIYHNFKSAQHGHETPFYMYMQTRNAFIFSRRHYHGAKKLQFFALYPIYLLYRFLFELQSRNFKSAKAMISGFVDSMKGFTGTTGLAERAFYTK